MVPTASPTTSAALSRLSGMGEISTALGRDVYRFFRTFAPSRRERPTCRATRRGRFIESSSTRRSLRATVTAVYGATAATADRSRPRLPVPFSGRGEAITSASIEFRDRGRSVLGCRSGGRDRRGGCSPVPHVAGCDPHRLGRGVGLLFGMDLEDRRRSGRHRDEAARQYRGREPAHRGSHRPFRRGGTAGRRRLGPDQSRTVPRRHEGLPHHDRDRERDAFVGDHPHGLHASVRQDPLSKPGRCSRLQ